MRSIDRACVTSLLIASVTLTGCTRGVREDLASHNYSTEVTVEPVRKTAEYWVRARVPGDEKFREVPGTRRFLHAGDVVGFQTDEVGTVVATHNNMVRTLNLPPGSDVVWHAKFRRKTQFGREMDKLGRGALEVGQTVMLGTLIVGGTVLAGAAAWHEFKCGDDCTRHDHR
jgi:hypothetical protein